MMMNKKKRPSKDGPNKKNEKNKKIIHPSWQFSLKMFDVVHECALQKYFMLAAALKPIKNAICLCKKTVE